jgi:hypothetical protein
MVKLIFPRLQNAMPTILWNLYKLEHHLNNIPLQSRLVETEIDKPPNFTDLFYLHCIYMCLN